MSGELGPYISLDFEYNTTKNAKYNLVACALTDGTTTKSIWLHKNPENYEKLKRYLLAVRDTHTLIAFNVDAEGKSLVSLGLNPIKFKWIDIQAEWKMLTNHNDSLGYGKQFIDGKFKRTFRRAYGDDKDKRAHNKTPINLLGCTYKLLGIGTEEDYYYKDKMRKLVIRSKVFTDDERDEILKYCSGDIKDLYQLYLAVMKHYKKLIPKKLRGNLHEEMLWRGETVARAAVISAIGYPVDRGMVTNFTRNIPKLVKDIQEDINKQFPDMEVFYWNKKENRYSLNTKAVKIWIQNSKFNDVWERTEKKALSLKLDAWEKHFHFRHKFPRDNFPAQFLRYKKVEQSLNGFKPKSVTAKNKDTFFSYYGEDDRAHPYLNAYGAQSARYQPKALGFIHLKAAWMRSLVSPKPGRAIVGIDYGSEEFLLAALLSGDENMLESYRSGDVYLYFAKLAGAVPWDGVKADYKKERGRFKSTTLGISYQMGSKALAAKLTMDTGEPHTQEEAQKLVNLFYEAYPKYQQWIWDNEEFYQENDYLVLPCGWYMFGDNDNRRSVGNMPIQGVGSSILRKGIQLAQDAGLRVIIPLHDAIYIEYSSDDLSAVDTLTQCMRDAFAFYFEGVKKQQAYELIRLDINIWSPDYEDGKFTTPKGLTGKKQSRYVDDRSETEYNQFSKYFR